MSQIIVQMCQIISIADLYSPVNVLGFFLMLTRPSHPRQREGPPLQRGEEGEGVGRVGEEGGDRPRPGPEAEGGVELGQREVVV